jgi:hypothetical protein
LLKLSIAHGFDRFWVIFRTVKQYIYGGGTPC